MTQDSSFDIIIVGAGASGLMCAITAAKGGKRIAILEKEPRAALRVLASGGGRCNFSNRSISEENYLCSQRGFVTQALSAFSPKDFTSFLKKHRVEFIEEADGKFFCQNSSKELVDLFMECCKKAHLKIETSSEVKSIRQIGSSFSIRTTKGDMSAKSVVIATGGIAHPQLCGSGFGYRIAKQFGHTIRDRRPALAQIVFNKKDAAIFGKLSGISFDGVVICGESSCRGSILITHRGLSGPAILNATLRLREGEPLNIDLMPDCDIERKLCDAMKGERATELRTLLSHEIPKRLADAWCATNYESRPIKTISKAEIKKIASMIHNWEIMPQGIDSYHAAEVTSGGIETCEINPKTMESKLIRGLYFTGEVLDVTGELGGYNLHWAWASGNAAGVAIKSR